MKTFKPCLLAFSLFFLIFFPNKIHAQNDPKTEEKGVYVPDSLKARIVVLGVVYYGGWVFTIEDGAMKGGQTIISSTTFTNEYAISRFSRLLAGACNKIAKQGYKLMSSNEAPNTGQQGGTLLNGTVYVFQKE